MVSVRRAVFLGLEMDANDTEAAWRVLCLPSSYTPSDLTD
jgi:hypothetical protein